MNKTPIKKNSWQKDICAIKCAIHFCDIKSSIFSFMYCNKCFYFVSALASLIDCPTIAIDLTIITKSK